MALFEIIQQTVKFNEQIDETSQIYECQIMNISTFPSDTE